MVKTPNEAPVLEGMGDETILTSEVVWDQDPQQGTNEMFQDLGPITDPQTIDTITVTTRITPTATFIWLDTETGEVYVDYQRMYTAS